MSNERVFYTAQTDIVFETLMDKGIYVVKKEFIQEKYGKVAPIMFQAYNWFVKEFEKKIKHSENAEYPIWLFEDPKYAKVHISQNIMKLSIPEDQFILFDNRGWERVLSSEYVGLDEADEKKFENKIRNYGIDCGYAAFEKPFYPHIKNEIQKSWARIFDIKESSVVRAAIWELKKEWIREFK